MECSVINCFILFNLLFFTQFVLGGEDDIETIANEIKKSGQKSVNWYTNHPSELERKLTYCNNASEVIKKTLDCHIVFSARNQQLYLEPRKIVAEMLSTALKAKDLVSENAYKGRPFDTGWSNISSKFLVFTDHNTGIITVRASTKIPRSTVTELYLVPHYQNQYLSVNKQYQDILNWTCSSNGAKADYVILPSRYTNSAKSIGIY